MASDITASHRVVQYLLGTKQYGGQVESSKATKTLTLPLKNIQPHERDRPGNADNEVSAASVSGMETQERPSTVSVQREKT